MTTPTKDDRKDFRAYCKQCTDTQLRNVYSAERAARRRVYADIAKEELATRGLKPEKVE